MDEPPQDPALGAERIRYERMGGDCESALLVDLTDRGPKRAKGPHPLFDEQREQMAAECRDLLPDDDLRAAIVEGTTRHHGSFHGTGQVMTFGRQLRKYSRDAGAIVRAQVRRDGSGRDLGYPGGAQRPTRFEEEWAAQRTREERRS